MKSAILAVALTAMSGVALAQQATPPVNPPGPGAGNPPSGWSGGATPPSSDTGKMHPGGKAPTPAPAPSTATAPSHSGDIIISSQSEARARIEAEGFTRVSDLKKDADGTWMGRAIRGTSNVAVRVDTRGNVSAE